MTWSSLSTIRQHFWMLLFFSPVLVLTRTFRTIPSSPGYTLTSRARSHFLWAMLRSVSKTTSLTASCRATCRHFLHDIKVWRYSLMKCFQNWVIRPWTNSNRLCTFLVSLNGPLRNICRCTSNHEVVRGKRPEVIGIIRWITDRSGVWRLNFAEGCSHFVPCQGTILEKVVYIWCQLDSLCRGWTGMIRSSMYLSCCSIQEASGWVDLNLSAICSMTKLAIAGEGLSPNVILVIR